jgi:hypothetical protein
MAGGEDQKAAHCTLIESTVVVIIPWIIGLAMSICVDLPDEIDVSGLLMTARAATWAEAKFLCAWLLASYSVF